MLLSTIDGMQAEHPVLFFDGVCKFCNGAVQAVLKHDSRGVVRFAPLQSESGRRLFADHPELAGIDSVIFVEEDGRVSARSEAALRVALRVGGWWRILLVGRLLPRAFRDWLYDAFAKRRYRLFGKHDACMIPSPEARSRFVDVAGPDDKLGGSQ